MSHSEPRSLAQVTVGEALPERTYRPSGLHLALMNFTNWATHRIHYDKDWAERDGFKDVVVQTGLLCAWIETMLVEWAGHPRAIRKLAFRNLALPFVDEEFDVTGEVAEKRDNGEVVITARVRRRGDDQDIVTATATLMLA